MPQEVDQVVGAWETIHHHYQFGLDRDGPDSYWLSREMERLSKRLRQMYRVCPWVPQLNMLSDQLRYMGRDVQVGPQRLRYRTMPKHPFDPQLLLPGVW